MNNSFSTPILFLIFNRPDTTKRVFQKIRDLQPKYLYVSADGPRNSIPGENKLCEETRKVIQVDWACELKTNYLENNLGCKMGVTSGINWFFENVEEGIILEDDCLPSSSFFSFCETMLEKYRIDKRIMHISGINFQNGIWRGEASYYYSKYVHVWGWATWKRAWKEFDPKLLSFPELLSLNKLHHLFEKDKESSFWLKYFRMVFENRLDTWDYQWFYANRINNSLSIIPNKNLVSNIGFGEKATHTIKKKHSLSNIHAEEIIEITYPKFMIADKVADEYTFKKHFKKSFYKRIVDYFRK